MRTNIACGILHHVKQPISRARIAASGLCLFASPAFAEASAGK
jgi:hypothetical protein